ncbi:MAG TPA: Uma2 family endonuclease [Polyangiaceae bacterium]|nr:Uma2 family endonuclease [Polyangiaceae bacterium]
MSSEAEPKSAPPAAAASSGASVSGTSASNTGVVVNGVRYVRAPVPVRFPDSELVPETKRHLEQRSLLYEILKLHFAESAIIGCDQFVYWDPTDPKQCLAPDAFVRLGAPDCEFRSWKVWERGAPDVAVEIISHADARDKQWEPKFEKYRRLGVRELVRFEGDHEGSISLRIWDSIDDDLVEREGVQSVAASHVLPGAWVAIIDSHGVPRLRLSRDADGKDLYPTPTERAELAEARIRELEAELARRGERP